MILVLLPSLVLGTKCSHRPEAGPRLENCSTTLILTTIHPVESSSGLMTKLTVLETSILINQFTIGLLTSMMMIISPLNVRKPSKSIASVVTSTIIMAMFPISSFILPLRKRFPILKCQYWYGRRPLCLARRQRLLIP